MTTAHRVLLAAPLPPPVMKQLGQLCTAEMLGDRAEADALLAARGSDFTVLVTNATTGASAALIARLPRLRAICSLGVGTDAIDVAAAKARGIVVTYTPDVLNDCVADLAMGMLIDVARGMSASDRQVRRGDWAAQGPSSMGVRVSGKRLGLVGMGRIARAIVARATGFGMEIRYHCRSPKADLPWLHEASLVQLAQWADFLVLACTGGEETRHLVSSEVLQALGPAGFLVNVARGSVVDEAALVAALQSGVIAGAALDVFEQEPRVPEAFFALENAVLLTHIGSATRETRQAMADLLLANVRSVLEHGRGTTEVQA